MQTIKLTHKPAKYFDKIFQNQKGKFFKRNEPVFSFKEVFLNILLPIFILIVFILFTAITLVFYRKSIVKNRFWNMNVLTKRHLSEFPHPIIESSETSAVEVTVDKNNIYDNYENLMNLKQNDEKKPLSKLQLLLNSSKFYTSRVKQRNRKPEIGENVSGSNSTSGTLIATPLLDNTGQFQNFKNHQDSLEISPDNVNFDYDYLKAPGEYQMRRQNDKIADKNEKNGKITFKSVNLKAFIQKMNSRKSNLKSIKRIHRTQRLGSDYDNETQETEEYYKVTSNAIN